MKIAPWVIAVALGGILLWGWSCHERQVGELNGRIAHLVTEQRRVDTVYRADTLKLTKVRRITDSLLITDTVIHTDTVRVLIAQERAACNAVIVTCEQRVAVRDSIIKVLKKKPSVWGHLPWVLGGVVVGKILLK